MGDATENVLLGGKCMRVG